jgi:hypothetical protein
MRFINKAGLVAGALTTLLILASCSDSDTSTGVTAGRDAANLGDASGDHDGDATVDDPTGPPETDAGGGRDGDGQGSDTNSLEILPDDESICRPLSSEAFVCEMKKLMCNVGDIYTNQRAAQCQAQGYGICEIGSGQPRACLGDGERDVKVNDDGRWAIYPAKRGSVWLPNKMGNAVACWDVNEHRWEVGPNNRRTQEYFFTYVVTNGCADRTLDQLPPGVCGCFRRLGVGGYMDAELFTTIVACGTRSDRDTGGLTTKGLSKNLCSTH